MIIEITKPADAVEVLDGQGWVSLDALHGSEKDVVSAARVAYGRVDRGMDETDKRLLKRLHDQEHMVPFEFVDVVFTVKCPLFVRSQIVRHRTAKFVELSRRYVKDGFEFYNPGGDNGAYYELAHQNSLDMYYKLLARGERPERARGVLSTNLMTYFKMKCDLRNFMHFLDLRTSQHAQEETRMYAEAMRNLVANRLTHLSAVKGWSHEGI